MTAAPSLPIPAEELRRWRLKLARTTPARGQGQHLRRRAGQALEFRDHRAYVPGDDIRWVDWRASLRSGRRDQLLIRRFEAEEQVSLVVLVDSRPAMRLPESLPKLTVAAWAVACLAEIVAQSGDALLLAGLFSPPGAPPPAWVRGPAARGAAARFLTELATPDPRPLAALPTPAVRSLMPRLRPASVVLMISDMLFDDPLDEVAALADAAQRARRELVVLELDSFAYETAELAGPARLLPVEGRDFGKGLRQIGTAEIGAARQAIAAHRAARWRHWARGGLVWPLDEPLRWPLRGGGGDWFADAFVRVPGIRVVLAREAG